LEAILVGHFLIETTYV